MFFRELNSGGYENTKYRINRVVLQESGKVVEEYLNCEELEWAQFQERNLI